MRILVRVWLLCLGLSLRNIAIALNFRPDPKEGWVFVHLVGLQVYGGLVLLALLVLVLLVVWLAAPSGGRRSGGRGTSREDRAAPPPQRSTALQNRHESRD